MSWVSPPRYEGLEVPDQVHSMGGYQPRTRCYQPVGGSGPPKAEETPSPGPPIAEAEGPAATPAGGWNAPRGPSLRPPGKKPRRRYP